MMQAVHDLTVSGQELALLRLERQATALAFALAQHFQTRAVMLVASTGIVVVHRDVAVLREWLRHYANCGRYGRRCFVDGRSVCRYVPALPGGRKDGGRR
jgi:hypothetical protein